MSREAEMPLGWMVAVLLLLALALAGTYALLAAPCQEHACSNDAPVCGDEGLAWDPAPGATWYEIHRDVRTAGVVTGWRRCAQTTVPEFVVAAGSPCRLRREYALRVRACNDAGCSDLSDEQVTFRGGVCR